VNCGFHRIKLGDGNHQDLFTFKLGDRVRSKKSKVAGIIEGGDCYQSADRPDQVFYRMQLVDGTIWTLRPDDLEPVPIEKAS